MIYFDHAATTACHPEVVEAMLPFMQNQYANPSSLHRLGKEVRLAVEKAREEVADLINADPQEIVFTSGGTEANNLALIGTAYANWLRGKHIIASAVEHKAVLEPLRYLSEQGFAIDLLPVDEAGMVDVEELKRKIRPDTFLISVMHANNEVGTIQPVEEIGELVRERGIIFHTDAVQTAGRLPIDVQKMGCHLLTISAHKMYGPKGIGCLYVKKGVSLHPLLHGGGQENGLRAGTENVAGIVGFGKAAKVCKACLEAWSWQLTYMRDRLIEGINERIPGAYLTGHRANRLPGHVSFAFVGVDSHEVVQMLDDKGIAVSGGAACNAPTSSPSHVLKAMGYSDELAKAALRISLGRENTDEELDYFLAILPDIISLLRDVRPAFMKNMEERMWQDRRDLYR